MGLFDFLKKQQDSKSTVRKVDLHDVENISSLQELFERFSGVAFEKQLAISDSIANLDWNVDMSAGTVTFGEKLTFPIQMLGSVSHQSQTWLWAWANAQAQISPDSLTQAIELKAYGSKNNIPELTETIIPATDNEGHVIASIASGMFKNRFYYAGNYGAGTAFFTIDVTEEELKEQPESVLEVFPQLIMTFELNHKKALSFYLKDKGYRVFETNDSLTGVSAKITVTAYFDELNRMTNLETTM